MRIHYNQQKLAAAVDFVRLEWKYVSDSKTRSERITATRMAETTMDERDRTADDQFIPIFVKKIRDSDSQI